MAHKIATCNYCGTRAALVLDRDRHELACSSCGAPLHDMKAMPKSKSGARHDRSRARPMPLPRQPYDGAPPRSRRPKKKRKGLGRRMLEEVWDVVEDIFD